MDDRVVAAFDDKPFGGRYLVVGTFSQTRVSGTGLVVNPIGIYPNPSSQTINIESLEAGKHVEVLNVLGREILSVRVPTTGPLTLDVSSLPAGLYYVSDGRSRTKFVKE
ncbi:MAG TPA: T9SS type A sorting domain-containing protein [Candidatus Kapabacteria bacterium]|nr:T9SS type A sorting domain-containing protein [Candidatus Kapabacteria bacterium]